MCVSFVSNKRVAEGGAVTTVIDDCVEMGRAWYRYFLLAST